MKISFTALRKTLFLLLFLPLISFAKKDPCKRIKKDTDKHKNTVTYKSPDLKSLEVIRQFNSDPFFVIHLHFYAESQHFDTKGAVIEFEDGTTIQADVTIHCKEEMAMVDGGNIHNAMSHADKYILEGFFHITNDNIQKFLTKKIVRIQLHTASQNIHDKEATEIMNYIQCIYNIER